MGLRAGTRAGRHGLRGAARLLGAATGVRGTGSNEPARRRPASLVERAPWPPVDALAGRLVHSDGTLLVTWQWINFLLDCLQPGRLVLRLAIVPHDAGV